MATTTLLDWILSILRDPAERAAFQLDPDDYADRHGFGDLSPADVHDALWLIADNQSASWDHGSGHVHYPPPPPIHEHPDHAGQYLNHYITHDYAIVDNDDTEVDSSVHQDIETGGRDFHHHDGDSHDHDGSFFDEDLFDGDFDGDFDGEGREDIHDRDFHGGDFDQVIENETAVASGDGASAIGGVNRGDISSAGGDGATAFGQGDAVQTDFSDTDFGSGSAVNIGGGSAGGNAVADTRVDIRDSFRSQDNDTVRVQDDDTVTVSDDDTQVDDHSSTQDHLNSHNSTDVDDVQFDTL